MDNNIQQTKLEKLQP